MLTIALAVAAAIPAEDPRAFISTVYAEYRRENFSPLEHPERYFSPELTAAIRQDGAGGEVGYLDGDPLCDCQDYLLVEAQVISLRAGTKAADAHVRVNLGAGEKRNLELKLVLTHSGWRISDVIGTDHQSLLRELQPSNARH